MESGWRELWQQVDGLGMEGLEALGMDRVTSSVSEGRGNERPAAERSQRSPSFASSAGFAEGRGASGASAGGSTGSRQVSSESTQVVDRLGRVEDQIGQLGKVVRADEQILRLGRIEEQLGRLGRIEEQLVRMEDKVDDGFRRSKEQLDERFRRSMDQMEKLSERQSSLEASMSKRQASLESDVSKRHSSLEASLEASKGASQVSRSLEVALDRMEERILQRYSNLEEAVSRKGALDEVTRRIDTVVDNLEAKLESRMSRSEEQVLQSILRNRGEVVNSLRDSIRDTVRGEKFDKQELMVELSPMLEDSSGRVAKTLEESMSSLAERMEKHSDSLRKSVQADLGTIAKRCELMTEAMRSRTEALNEQAHSARQVSSASQAQMMERQLSTISVEDIPMNEGYQLNELRASVDNGIQFLADRLVVLHRELMEIYSAITKTGQVAHIAASPGVFGTSMPSMAPMGGCGMPGMPGMSGMSGMAGMAGMPLATPTLSPQAQQAPPDPNLAMAMAPMGQSPEGHWADGMAMAMCQGGMCHAQMGDGAQGAQQETSFDLLDSGDDSPPLPSSNGFGAGHSLSGCGGQVASVITQAARAAMELDERMKQARAPGARRRPRTAEQTRPQPPPGKAATGRRPQTAERGSRRRDVTDRFSDSNGQMDLRRRSAAANYGRCQR